MKNIDETTKCPYGICDGSGVEEVDSWDENAHEWVPGGDTRECLCAIDKKRDA